MNIGLEPKLSQWLVLSLFLLCVGILAGCGEPEVKLPVKAMPAGASYTGLWYSNYDDMNLVQEGTKVQGTFDFKTGGVINGTLEGGVLLFDWTQTGDLSVGRREVTGKGYFVISDDGLAFEGRWGYGESRSNGGAWTADKAVEKYTE